METMSFFPAATLLLLIIDPFGNLVFSPLFHARQGRAATSAIERLVGMLLIMVSVQIFLDGVGECLAHS